jgi:YegS/Rv2252/BmrU family lipid kinase
MTAESGSAGPIVFVVNPRSANGATLRRFERVRDKFASALGNIDVKLTERPKHASELARAAIRAGAKAVIAVGGDGTNNEVVNGFFDEAGARMPGTTAFGVVTSGTGGDFRRTFHWSTEPLDDLERLRRFQTRPIDIGKLTVTTDEGPKTHYFVNIASFGVSGDVVNVVNTSSKALGAKLSFMVGSLRATASYKSKRVRLTHDGDAPWEGDIAYVAVANGQYFGGSMWVAPEAKPDDGLFDVVTCTGDGTAFWLKHVKVYQGKHLDFQEVSVKRARRVLAEPVRADEKVLVEIDGEQPGRLPATFEIVPSALPLLV